MGLAVAVMADVGPNPQEMAKQLIRMRHAIDLQEVAFARLAAEFAATDLYDEEGFVSPIDWIRFNCHMTSNAAADRVAVGEHLGKLSSSVAEMASGGIGFAHVVVMARTAGALGRKFAESELLEAAIKNSPGKFHHLSRHYRHAADAAGYATEEAEQIEQRRLVLSTAEDGMVLVNGVLDPAGGATLRSALEPLARKSGEHDDRERDQRWADALVELAAGGEQKAQLQVTSSVETLLGLVGAPAAELEFSLPISTKTVERLACECSLTRVLMQESMVIDVGRSKRTVEGATRRALNARDGHCRWPGCERPPKWSAAHHVVHWIHGGTTELDNLILLCHRHHRLVHEGGWQIVRGQDGDILTVPPTVRFAMASRGPD